MQKFVLLGLLSLCSWEDIRKKELTIPYILLFGIGGVWLHLFFPVCSIYSIIGGTLLGAAMVLASLASKGGIGMGDGILLVVTGVYLGGSRNLKLFFMGLLLAACWSLGLLAFRKKKGNETIAFAPFLLLSYLFMLAGWQI